MSKTEVVFILDGSASMYGVKDAVIKGFNKLIAEQKEKNISDLTITMNIFDSYLNRIYEAMDIKDVKEFTELDYSPKKDSSLIDSVGQSLDMAVKGIGESDKEHRPDDVLVVIISDGFEHTHRKYTSHKLKNKIEYLQKVNGWKFIFFGMNCDKDDSMYKLGILNFYPMRKNKEEIEEGFHYMSRMVTAHRRFFKWKETHESEDLLNNE